MSNRPPRQISLLDAMILISAIAIGLSIQRAYLPDLLLTLVDEHGHRQESGAGQATVAVLRALVSTLPWGLAVTFAAVGILLLHPPQPRLRRLIRQPGPAACLVAASALVVEMGFVGLRYVLAAFTEQNSPCPYRLPSPPFIRVTTVDLGGPPPEPFPSYGTTLFQAFAYQVAPSMGWAVATAWIILAIGGGWRRERSGVGRLGWFVGLYWMTASALIRLLLIVDSFLR